MCVRSLEFKCGNAKWEVVSLIETIGGNVGTLVCVLEHYSLDVGTLDGKLYH